MNLTSRRLRRTVASLSAVAALSALTACASEKKDDEPQASPSASASATPSTTPTTTPDQVQAFCNSLVALDTAIVSLGPPEDDEEGGPSASPSPSSMAGMDMSTPMAGMNMSTPMASSTPTGAPEGAGGPPPVDLKATIGPVADMMAATKTREIAPQADAMIAILRQAADNRDRKVLDSDAYGAADAPLDAYGLKNCNYKAINVSAIEYEYDNAPSTAAAGKTTVTLKNEGKEFHEVVLLRINEGVTDSVDDIMELGEDQLFSKVTPAMFTFAPPGLSSTAFTDLKAGRYIMLCFIPKGTKPGVEPEADAPPHFTEGMLEEVVVS